MSGVSVRRRPGTAGGAGAPASLREALTGVPETQRDLYLYLREAILALGGTAERFRSDGRTWRPTLSCRHREIARVAFSGRGRGRRKEMSVELPLTPSVLEALSGAGELRAATREALARAAAIDAAPPRLTVADEADLAEVVAVLMLAEARLRSEE